MAYQKKILVVEDNDLNRAILSSILSGEYAVLEAENGLEALKVLRQHKDSVSLILLDVMMPVMDGYTFLDHMREDADLAHIPVIVTTQGNSEEDELAALAHGATDFVPKPYRPQIILHRVAALIKLRETAAMVNQLQYDHLTGLYTKEFFLQKVRQQLQENPVGEYCIIGSNIENFKLINDVFGIATGDRLLQETAKLASKMVGEAGFCGRFGADRFLCFIKCDQEKMKQMIRVYDSSEKLSPLAKSVTLRWGIYVINDHSLSIEQMCDRAFLAADSIKKQYNRHYAFYDDSLRNRLLREQQITSAMESALEEGQFKVYLQPKISLQDNRMVGAEALVRWIHPEWGFMSPGEFIPLFEKNGFIPKLDLYVWEQVLIRQREWKKMGYPLLPISVNVSRADVLQGNLADIIFDLTRKHGVDPACLHLEITESVYAENAEQLVETVETLRKRGFIVEMDDFGSGYSSLNMLSQMSMDILKLDMKFVQNELAKPVEQSFLIDIINMAHRAHMHVVAEGVETREQMLSLRGVGCDYAQGYYFAKPMPTVEYEQLLKDWKPGGPVDAQNGEPDFQDCILVVDEDAAYRKKVQKTFENAYRLIETENARQAIDILQSDGHEKICAIILSMTLTENGAKEVMQALRRSPAYWETPVLATLPSGDCCHNMPLALEADDFLCKCHPLFDMHRRVQRLIDIVSFHHKECVLQNAASHDPLTGLLNRRGLQEALSGIADGNANLALCLFDLDCMKHVNDTYGHEMGDKVLCSFADILCRMTRAEDVKCRYGGDEFIVIMKGMENMEVARNKGEDICRSFRSCCDQLGIQSSCSAGIVLCRADENVLAQSISHADQALYRAKQQNKGSCCIWKG